MSQARICNDIAIHLLKRSFGWRLGVGGGTTCTVEGVAGGVEGICQSMRDDIATVLTLRVTAELEF